MNPGVGCSVLLWGIIPDPGIKSSPLLRLLHWQAGYLPLAPPRKPRILHVLGTKRMAEELSRYFLEGKAIELPLQPHLLCPLFVGLSEVPWRWSHSSVQLKPSKEAGRRGGVQPPTFTPRLPRGLITPDLSPSPPASGKTSLSTCFIPHSLPCLLGSLIIRIPLNK